MKYSVTRFKSLAVALKEIEPFVRNGQYLETGKPFVQLKGMLLREVLANWLICITVNFEYKTDRMSFTNDPLGGDGRIVDSLTEETWPTEHVMVPRPRSAPEAEKTIETRILEAINLKRQKGDAAYASGKKLVVFLNAGDGSWIPNSTTAQLPEPLHFEDVWVVGLLRVEAGKYVYGVSQLRIVGGNAPTWSVEIGTNFDTWQVKRIQ